MKKASTPSGGKHRSILGPYERWNFFDGREHALLPVKENRDFLTAMATVSNPVPLATIDGRVFREEEERSWFPTLWAPDDLEVSFLPFIVPWEGYGDRLPENAEDKAKPNSREVSFDDTSAFENLFSDSLRRLLPEKNNIEKVRIAFPVSADAMIPDNETLPNDPVACASGQDPENCTEDPWVPDKEIKKWVKKNSSGQKRKHLTVLAIIDDGIPFAHQIYRDEAGERSRVEFCWMQSVNKEKTDDRSTVRFGREYLRHDIEELIRQYGGDEDYLYHKSGALEDQGEFGSVLDQHGTHGAHVMDQACGYSKDKGEEIREEIRIIGVQLPNEMTLDTSGFGKDAYILAAFHYIFNRADIIAQGYGVDKLRLVVNLSFGFSAGRLDGNTDLECAIHQLVEHRRNQMKCPTALVMPAGNSFLSGLHAQISHNDFSDHNAFELDWNIQPNDRTSSYMEIWFPEGFDPKGYQVSATSPDGRIAAIVSIGQADVNTIDGTEVFRPVSISTPAGNSIGFVSIDRHQLPTPKGGGTNTRWRMTVILAPTEPVDLDLEPAPSGLWKVTLSRQRNSLPVGEGLIHFRIQRDENFSSSFTGARQSYIRDDNNILFDDMGRVNEFDSPESHVKRFGTINGLATGGASLIVGGFRKTGERDYQIDDGAPSLFSSAGILDQHRPHPQVDCSAMADRSTLLPGTIAAGTRSGSYSQLQGTSSAAPFVACAIAEAFVSADESEVQKSATKDGNYLDLLTRNFDDLNTRPVDVGSIFAGRASNHQLSMKTRMGNYLIIPKLL